MKKNQEKYKGLTWEIEIKIRGLEVMKKFIDEGLVVNQNYIEDLQVWPNNSPIFPLNLIIPNPQTPILYPQLGISSQIGNWDFFFFYIIFLKAAAQVTLGQNTYCATLDLDILNP